MKDLCLRILLVDDDEDDVMLFKEAISEINPNAEVKVFSEWKQLMPYIESTKETPHIIFMDYILPGKRGNELAEELHNTEKLKNVPVIICSGISEHLSFKKESCGVQQMIKKPQTFDQLVSTLRSVLYQRIAVA